jgi:hypothetical protein
MCKKSFKHIVGGFVYMATTCNAFHVFKLNDVTIIGTL